MNQYYFRSRRPSLCATITADHSGMITHTRPRWRRFIGRHVYELRAYLQGRATEMDREEKRDG